MNRVRSGVGISELDDSIDAGRHAARSAMARLGGASPALVMVYASIRYDLPALLAAIRGVTGEVPLVGASSSGHFHNGVMTPPCRGVTVLILSGGRYQFGVGSTGLLREDPFRGGRSLVEAARVSEPVTPYAGLILLSCGLVGDQQPLLNGVHLATGGNVPVVGGVAGDDRRMAETYVFDGEKVLSDSAVAVWVGSDHPLRVVHGHGWQRVGGPQLVTSVEGPVVKTIAGRPAFEVLQDQFGDVPPGALSVPAAEWAVADRRTVRSREVGRAFGLIDSDGGLRMRAVCYGERGEVETLVPVAPYSAIQVMSCTRDDLLGVCDKIVDQAMADQDASVMLAFSCVGRYELLGERAAEEAFRLHRAAKGTDTFGFYTYGEFARTTGVSGFHNATITAMAL